ncbi:MAG: exodeoxyribonuclease VII large subunit [Anaerolineae bacterium]|jgi:exodeoxyribonuclease VII large subunit|nr:exodeoxyribonuclease VII large subunit [Anaerolineae bacterium]MDX9831186.1 exodeoxyribonuclease VII large subunit [Anaerolineae bacterium]
MTGARVWTVGELTRHIRNLLEGDLSLRNVWLRGEISNLSRPASGHLYFSLKDAGASLKCVMWRSNVELLGWQPEHGAQVLARGRISVYPQGGVYQLYVDELHPAGVGDLHAQFEELRERLRAEGLFELERKRPLPPFPRMLGVVTSPQAAALRDVLQVLRRRWPLVKVLLAPTLVQGDMAPPQIVAALRALDARDDVDLILLVRGGGSLEELWAFNDEGVARAIAACRHPIVCGVGHETDFTIADFAADVRASTPTAAAELAVPDQADLRRRVRAHAVQVEEQVLRRLAEARQSLEREGRSLARLSPRGRIEAERQRLDELSRRASQALLHSLALRRAALGRARAQMLALSPQATLERGYAIVRREDTGVVVRSVQQAQAGDDLRIQVQDGELTAVTKGHHERRH